MNQPTATLSTPRREDRGFVLVVLLIVMMPTMLLLGAFTSAMVQRTHELSGLLEEERALLAAESGVDDAIYKGLTGVLTHTATYHLDLGSGMSCDVEPTNLQHDGKDNDGDHLIDEADENVYQVVVTGHYRNAARKLAAYLGPVPLLPAINSAVVVSKPGVNIGLAGSSQVSGRDLKLNGAFSGSLSPGLATTPPGTVAGLDGQLTGSERDHVVGAGGTPSLALAPAIDWATMVPQLQNAAGTVLAANSYSNLHVGSTSPWTGAIAYRNGDLRINGNSTGVGILLVNGNLEVLGNLTWYGVVIVLGNFN
ncbi:MAG TPA: hypothetical protein VK348_00080, partial [Planctomycetota bacterium]|nr:hypothetical protein [Planctomycetota bacterium]